MRMFDLTGKKAIVTGGTGGLGRSIAEGLHAAGADLALIDVSENVALAAQELEQAGKRGIGIRADLRDRADLRRGFDEAVTALKGLDILVNSHGIVNRHRSEEFPMDDWDTLMEINLNSVFLLCQLAGNIMLAQGHGKIINLASMLSFSGGYTVPAYAASKGGVGQLTKALTNEWASHGICVNAIAPGYMDTPMNAKLFSDPTRAPQILARIPAGRWGDPAEIQGLAIFLASDASNYVHGAIIPLDGGFLAR